MKVFCVLGGPNTDGNSAQVLGWIESELKEKGHEIDHVNIVDVEVNGCKACFACKANIDEPACIQTDDGNQLFNRMIAADGLVFAAPLFCWGFPSQIKALLDRSICLVRGFGSEDWGSLIADKPLGLVVTGGGPVEKNIDLIDKVFQRYAKYLLTDYVGELLVPFCTTPDEMKPEVREQAREFAARIAKKS